MDKCLPLYALAYLSVLLSVAACEEPSTVGAGLIEDKGQLPESTVVPLSTAQDTSSVVTGNAQRILAGAVNDPLLGEISATGYVDFVASSSVDSTFRSKDLRLVYLDLFLSDYVYGDTTGTITLRLRDMPTEWEADGATADTSLIAGSSLTEFTVAIDDSLTSVKLPQTWVQAHESEILSENFEDMFHGFQLEPQASNAVVGFDASRSRLRAIAGADTALYSASKSLTTIASSGENSLPPNRLVLQAGTGQTVRITVADTAALPPGAPALNHAEFRLDFDTETLNTSTSFFRPRLQRLRLYGIRIEDGTPLQQPLFDFRRTDTDEYTPLPISAAPAEVLRQIFQRRLLGDSLFERFVLVPLSGTSDDSDSGFPGTGDDFRAARSLDIALIYTGDNSSTCAPGESSTCPPRVELIYTPAQ